MSKQYKTVCEFQFRVLTITLIAAAIFQIAGCEKYLDKKSDSSLTVPTTLKELQALLDHAIVMNFEVDPSLGEASADDYYLLEPTFNSMRQIDRDVYTWQLQDYIYPNDWSKAYLPVYNANYCLERLEQIEKTNSNLLDWNIVKGSAHFYRAYSFLNLSWLFSKAYDENTSSSDLGIVLRTSSDFNIPSSRSTVKETYQQIIKDAEEAADILPITRQRLTQPSKAAAYALLARTYLSMRDYDNALKYSDLCLQINSQLMDYNGDPEVGNLTATSPPFAQFNKETIFYCEMNSTVTPQIPSRAKIDSVLYSTYDINDLRKTGFFRSSSGWRFKGSYTASTILFSGIATDEMYLIKAECLARKGEKDAAMNELNALLIKRWKTGFFVPENAIDSQQALDIILLERRKELLMRGLRWIDLKRLNKEGLNIVPKRLVSGQPYQLPANSNYYALPLPKDIIELTGIPQN